MFKKALKMSGEVVTLNQTIDCDLSPVELFEICAEENNLSNRMLLESSEIESKQNLKSILLNKAALRIECNSSQVVIQSLTANGNNAVSYLAEIFEVKKESNSPSGHLSLIVNYESPISDSNHQPVDEETRLKQITPIDCLRKIQRSFTTQSKNPFSIFLGGVFAFDFIASFEKLPAVETGKNKTPDYLFYLAEELIVFDHRNFQTKIFANIFAGDGSDKIYNDISRRMEDLSGLIRKENCGSSMQAALSSQNLREKIDFGAISNLSHDQYKNVVVDLKKEIVNGNIFQVVPSRIFSLPCKHSLTSYRFLKEANPSPYMFYFEDSQFVLFGASPESALKNQNSSVELYPIAGTRRRGKFESGEIDHDLDKRLETELKLDNKEVSEHMMLVDLARNDISRISKTGSLQIPRLLEVDRYSQVMHLVSCVQGELKPDLDCFHAYQACMNMGTLTGAPKIKATELIRTTEKERRGSYGGAIGYIDSNGDMDTCIVIRSAYCKDGTAYVQSGAGIVYDSIPQSESEETVSKARAVVEAILDANAYEKNENTSHAGGNQNA